MPKQWKKGRAKLGLFDPLLGDWIAETDTPMGPARCRRTLVKTLRDTRIDMRVRWELGKGRAYEELAIIGAGFHWAVESKKKKGWNRFTEHHYRPSPSTAR